MPQEPIKGVRLTRIGGELMLLDLTPPPGGWEPAPPLSRLERLAEELGVDPDDLRRHLRNEVDARSSI